MWQLMNTNPVFSWWSRVFIRSLNLGVLHNLGNYVKKVKSAYEPSDPASLSYTGFYSIRHVRVFLLPSGWEASPLQGLPPALSSPVPIYTPGRREAQHNIPNRAAT